MLFSSEICCRPSTWRMAWCDGWRLKRDGIPGEERVNGEGKKGGEEGVNY